MFSLRKKAGSRNYHICSSVGNIKTVRNDHEIKVGSTLFKVFAGQSVHKSTGTSDPEIADQIANELSRIVLEENPAIATKRKKGEATVEVPAPRKLGDPENIDNWTMADAVQYRIDNEPDMTSSVRYHLERSMRTIYVRVPNSNLPEKLAHWPIMDADLLDLYVKYRWAEIEARDGKERKGSTKNKDMNTFRVALRLAERVSHKYSDGRFRVLKIPHWPEETDNSHNVLSVKEAQAVFDWLRVHHPKNLDMFLIQTYAGARPVEVARLTWDDVKLDDEHPQNSRIKLWNLKGSGKRKRTRWMHLSPILIDVFKRQTKSPKDNFVFHNRLGQPYPTVGASGYSRPPSYTRCFRDAVNALGLHGKTSYALRHSFGTWLLNNGENLVTVMRLMGHAKITTTQRYLETADQTKIAAVNKLPGSE
tara:strand:- start:1166 stop:2425 length:1260 start_codon:yes stop_codon:yes gene_type:complete